MAGKTLLDSVAALWPARIEWKENEAFCAYCQVATLCSLVSFVLAVPEATSAIRYLLGKSNPDVA